MKKKPVVVTTFSGCGGSSMGYKLAECNVALSIDFEKKAVETYQLNFPETQTWQANVREVTGEQILKKIGMKKGELDIFDGSPPCTSFSMAGLRHKGWGKEYKHNKESVAQRTDDLFFEYIRLVKEIEPKIFIAENVRGMIIGSAKGYFNEILAEMKKLNYEIRVLDLNAQDFEVPQSRSRLIFIGIRKDVFKKWELLKTHKQIPLYEAWKGIKNTEKELKEANYDRTQKFKDMWKHVKPGESLKKYHPKGSYFTYAKLDMNKPSKVILADSIGQIRHPSEERTLTLPEMKRIGSFPDDFKFLSYSDAWVRIGNAVPPNLIKNIAKYALSCANI